MSEETKNPEQEPVDDGVIRITIPAPQKEVQNEGEDELRVQPVEEVLETQQPNEVEPSENVEQPVQNEEQPHEEVGVLEEITDDSSSTKEVVEAQNEPQTVQESVKSEPKVELPENIQKLVDFVNETGGTLEDYVRLNQDIDSLNEAQLLREYYAQTKPHLDKEEVDFLLSDTFAYDEDVDDEREVKRKKLAFKEEVNNAKKHQLLREYYAQTKPHLDKEEVDFLLSDTFAYDEDVDDEREVKRKKLAFKEEVNNAKKHLGSMKEKYYNEIKAGSRLTPDQQKAVDFFNRYNKEQEQQKQTFELQQNRFVQKTDEVFNDEFKGFEYGVGDKRYRYNVKNAADVKNTQLDINNFVRKFLDKDNTIADAKGYHKALFTAMNADAIANHFYEQGKADAMKDSVARSKNVDMTPRGQHEGVTKVGGMTVRAVSGDSSSKLRVKFNK